jgi:hypothetical protein
VRRMYEARGAAVWRVMGLRVGVTGGQLEAEWAIICRDNRDTLLGRLIRHSISYLSEVSPAALLVLLLIQFPYAAKRTHPSAGLPKHVTIVTRNVCSGLFNVNTTVCSPFKKGTLYSSL